MPRFSIWDTVQVQKLLEGLEWGDPGEKGWKGLDIHLKGSRE